MQDAPFCEERIKVGVEEIPGIIQSESLNPMAKLGLNHSIEMTNDLGNLRYGCQQICPRIASGFIIKQEKIVVPFQIGLLCRTPYITMHSE